MKVPHFPLGNVSLMRVFAKLSMKARRQLKLHKTGSVTADQDSLSLNHTKTFFSARIKH